MKSIACAALIGSLLFASCKGEENVNVYIGSGNWKLNNTTYQAYRVYKRNNALIGETNFASGENITVYFNTMPAADGVYNIKKFDFFNPVLGTNDVSILATGAGKNYGSIEADTLRPKATVSIVNGKIRLTLQETWMRNASGPDSVKLSGAIIENE